ncbi:MAG: flagellar hook-associated protein FlgK [Desulfosarcina sp.]|nr:flagellar hook-associated protein FlgK [Desulfobacterales bacterium]
MPDIYGILSTASRSLLTQQKAIDVTGQNIANVNTPGYSRQRVVMQSNTPIAFEPGQMGTGVKAAEIERIYDRYIGGQINRESMNLGQWEAAEGALKRIEFVFDESSGVGLERTLNEFWSAWQDLVNNPSGYPERTSLASRSQTLARTFNNMATNLRQIQEDYDKNISGTIDEINGIAAQIADLNHKISQVAVAGQNSNDYRDQRDLLLKNLSERVDLTTFENDAGQVTVLVGDGKPLVQSPYAWQLGTRTNATGLQDVVWLERDGTPTDITAAIDGGKLKGWLDVRDGYAQDYINRLDTLAQTIVTEVNALHQNGYGLTIDPVSGAPITGQNFFVATGTTAATMALDPGILNDVNRIAAATTAATVPGDNRNAVALASLQEQATMSGGQATFNDFYSTLVSSVGNDVRNASANHDYEDAMVTQLENYRESVAGVSLDEEMINLVKYQHAYEAAARVITTVDEMLNTLLNMA